jgi:hypothetical protein
MVGDGHLTYAMYIQGQMQSEVNISCNSKEFLYIQYIQSLFAFLFGVSLTLSMDKRSHAAILRIYSKSIVQFLHRTCEIPVNKKTDIVSVPLIVKCADAVIKCAFLRGLADTDFAISFKNKSGKGYNYPVVVGSFKSVPLVNDLEVLYQELGFKYYVVYSERKYDRRFHSYGLRNAIYLNGKENFRKWMAEIGSSHDKFQTKMRMWEETGFCPPKRKPPGRVALPTF